MIFAFKIVSFLLLRTVRKQSQKEYEAHVEPK